MFCHYSQWHTRWWDGCLWCTFELSLFTGIHELIDSPVLDDLMPVPVTRKYEVDPKHLVHFFDICEKVANVHRHAGVNICFFSWLSHIRFKILSMQNRTKQKIFRHFRSSSDFDRFMPWTSLATFESWVDVLAEKLAEWSLRTMVSLGDTASMRAVWN